MSDQTPDNPQVLPVVQTAQGPQDLSADTGVAPSAQPSPAPTAAPTPVTPAQAPAPTPGTPTAEAQHHGVLGEIFQTLAGGKKKVWQQTDKGPVATYQDLKPGEM